YIFNKEETILSGPIGSSHVFNRKYASDIIKGNEVILYVLVPTNKYESFDIRVTNVIFGFVDINNLPAAISDMRLYDDSFDCQVDFNRDSANFRWGPKYYSRFLCYFDHRNQYLMCKCDKCVWHNPGMSVDLGRRYWMLTYKSG